MRRLLRFLDGKKRSLVLLAYMLGVLIEKTGTPGPLVAALDWNPGGGLPVSVIAGTVLGTISIWHAGAKSLRAKAEKADTVSIRGLR